MPKKLTQDLAPEVEALVVGNPGGISVGEIAAKFAEHASRRTIGRVLRQLVRKSRIQIKGRSRTSRYYPPQPNQATANLILPAAKLEAQAEVYVPLSGDAPKLRAWVSRPITLRKPVGYDRAFLDNYRPNETFYLNDPDWRARLREIGRVPLDPIRGDTYARGILNRLLIDLSWASSQLEGNTYTRLDTVKLIEHSQEAAGKDHLETQMILNHKRAIEFLIQPAEEFGFNTYTFMNLHALLSENLLQDPAASGRLRQGTVEVQGSVYRPLDVPQLIRELFDQILEKAAAIRDPFEQSFFLMVHIPYLQPFADVNKRVSRLAANIPFMRNGLCPLSFVDVPRPAYIDGTLAVYEHTRVDLLRDVFTWAYERSCQQFKAIAVALPEPDPFRLKYRNELTEIVGDVVRAGSQGTSVEIRKRCATLVPEQDRLRFAEMASEELKNLHEGSIARYRLRLSEFRAWREAQAGRQQP